MIPGLSSVKSTVCRVRANVSSSQNGDQDTQDFKDDLDLNKEKVIISEIILEEMTKA